MLMTYLFLLTLTLLMTSMFLGIKTPLIMGIFLLFTTLMSVFLIGKMVSFWYGSILFLIYITGLLVMFAYFLAIQHDNMLMSSPLKNLTSLLSILMLMSYMFYFKSYTYFPMTSISNKPMFVKSILVTEYILPMSFILLSLLMVMIIVVKISSHNEGTLRPFN